MEIGGKEGVIVLGKKNGGGYGVKRSGVQQVGNFGLPSKFY
jgi:hypothetical protein